MAPPPILTPTQRVAMAEAVGGQPVEVATQLRARHAPTFHVSPDERHATYLGCSCGSYYCEIVLLLVHTSDLIAAYEGKVAELAAETARSITVAAAS